MYVQIRLSAGLILGHQAIHTTGCQWVASCSCTGPVASELLKAKELVKEDTPVNVETWPTSASRACELLRYNQKHMLVRLLTHKHTCMPANDSLANDAIKDQTRWSVVLPCSWFCTSDSQLLHNHCHGMVKCVLKRRIP